MNYDTIKRNFQRGLWSLAQVKASVRKGVITVAQYEEITGARYQ